MQARKSYSICPGSFIGAVVKKCSREENTVQLNSLMFGLKIVLKGSLPHLQLFDTWPLIFWSSTLRYEREFVVGSVIAGWPGPEAVTLSHALMFFSDQRSFPLVHLPHRSTLGSLFPFLETYNLNFDFNRAKVILQTQSRRSGVGDSTVNSQVTFTSRACTWFSGHGNDWFQIFWKSQSPFPGS